MRVTLKKIKRRNNIRKWNTGKLKSSEVKNDFQEGIESKVLVENKDVRRIK